MSPVNLCKGFSVVYIVEKESYILNFSKYFQIVFQNGYPFYAHNGNVLGFHFPLILTSIWYYLLSLVNLMGILGKYFVLIDISVIEREAWCLFTFTLF